MIRPRRRFCAFPQKVFHCFSSVSSTDTDPHRRRIWCNGTGLKHNSRSIVYFRIVDLFFEHVLWFYNVCPLETIKKSGSRRSFSKKYLRFGKNSVHPGWATFIGTRVSLIFSRYCSSFFMRPSFLFVRIMSLCAVYGDSVQLLERDLIVIYLRCFTRKNGAPLVISLQQGRGR